MLVRYPDLQPFVGVDGGAASGASAIEVFRDLSGFSLSLLAGIALTIIFFSTVAYIVLDPKLIIAFITAACRWSTAAPACAPIAAPPHAVIGWTKASLVIGAIQAMATFIFLSLMEVPGAWSGRRSLSSRTSSRAWAAMSWRFRRSCCR